MPGGYGGPAGRDGRAAPFFALVRAWAAGIVVLWLVHAVLSIALLQRLGTVDRLGSFGWRLVLLHLPNALAAGAAVFVAGRVHPEPYRSSLAWHPLAALTVPLVAQGFSLAQHWSELVGEGIWASSLAVLAGCLCGVLADVGRAPGRPRRP